MATALPGRSRLSAPRSPGAALPRAGCRVIQVHARSPAPEPRHRWGGAGGDGGSGPSRGGRGGARAGKGVREGAESPVLRTGGGGIWRPRGRAGPRSPQPRAGHLPWASSAQRQQRRARRPGPGPGRILSPEAMGGCGAAPGFPAEANPSTCDAEPQPPQRGPGTGGALAGKAGRVPLPRPGLVSPLPAPRPGSGSWRSSASRAPHSAGAGGTARAGQEQHVRGSRGLRSAPPRRVSRRSLTRSLRRRQRGSRSSGLGCGRRRRRAPRRGSAGGSPAAPSARPRRHFIHGRAPALPPRLRRPPAPAAPPAAGSGAAARDAGAMRGSRPRSRQLSLQLRI